MWRLITPLLLGVICLSVLSAEEAAEFVIKDGQDYMWVPADLAFDTDNPYEIHWHGPCHLYGSDGHLLVTGDYKILYHLDAAQVQLINVAFIKLEQDYDEYLHQHAQIEKTKFGTIVFKITEAGTGMAQIHAAFRARVESCLSPQQKKLLPYFDLTSLQLVKDPRHPVVIDDGLHTITLTLPEGQELPPQLTDAQREEAVQLRVAYVEAQTPPEEDGKETSACAQLRTKLLQLGVNPAIDNRYKFAYAFPRAGGSVNGGRKSGEFKLYERAYRYHVGELVEGDFPDLTADTAAGVKDSAGSSTSHGEELVKNVDGKVFLLIPADMFKEAAYWSKSYVIDEEDGHQHVGEFCQRLYGLDRDTIQHIDAALLTLEHAYYDYLHEHAEITKSLLGEIIFKLKDSRHGMRAAKTQFAETIEHLLTAKQQLLLGDFDLTIPYNWCEIDYPIVIWAETATVTLTPPMTQEKVKFISDRREREIAELQLQLVAARYGSDAKDADQARYRQLYKKLTEMSADPEPKRDYRLIFRATSGANRTGSTKPGVYKLYERAYRYHLDGSLE